MTETTVKKELSPVESRVIAVQAALSSNWPDYYEQLTQLPQAFELAACLKLLDVADQLMNQSNVEGLNQFINSNLIERYLIGGVEDSQTAKHYPFNTQLLGNMQGFASFKKVLKSAPEGLAKLLKIIPTYGRIDGWHFTQFIDAYQALFAANGFKQTHLFPATRLLTMKRPDQFVAINADSVELVCQTFAIKPLKKQDFQRYWDEVIVALQKTSWFNMEQPEEDQQTPIFRARMALFERFICQPNENYSNSAPEDTIVENKPSSESICSGTDTNTNNVSSNKISHEAEAAKTPVKKKVTQPKKMTIDKKKSAKVNKNAATKLMSQYYFANKEKFAKANMNASRDKIIAKLIDGESVEEAFKLAL